MIAFSRVGGTALAFAALALAGATPAGVRAEEPQSAALVPSPTYAPAPDRMPPITIRISVATASEAEGAVDPKASDIFEHLPNRFHSISLIEERTISVFPGERAEVPLPSGASVTLLPVAVHNRQLHMQLDMPEVLNTRMRLSNSRALYVGGVGYGDGTLVFKLVPEFSAYLDGPAPKPVPAPQTQPAVGKR